MKVEIVLSITKVGLILQQKVDSSYILKKTNRMNCRILKIFLGSMFVPCPLKKLLSHLWFEISKEGLWVELYLLVS